MTNPSTTGKKQNSGCVLLQIANFSKEVFIPKHKIIGHAREISETLIDQINGVEDYNKISKHKKTGYTKDEGNNKG